MNIKKFNLSNMHGNSNIGFHTNFINIGIFGHGNSGKTTLCKHLLKHYNSIPNKMIYSYTEKYNSFYKREFPNADIYLNDDFILSLKTILLDRLNKQENKNQCHTIILIDYLSNKVEDKNNIIKDLLMNSRHYGIIIIMVREIYEIDSQMSSCFDYLFLYNHYNLDEYYNKFAGMFKNVNQFKKIFKKVVNDYKCMVIDNVSHDRDINKIIYWFKVENDNEDNYSDTMSICETENNIVEKNNDILINNNSNDNSNDNTFTIKITKPSNNEKIKITIEFN